ncbi:MAG: alpha/beta hydrolase [Candidatus Saccharibacteria bacterium]
MTRFLILHGTDGSPEINWFMWLKGVLIGKGYEVWLPQLPNSDKPNAKIYNDFILSNSKFIFDENTILIGHSSGAVEILSLLQNLPESSKVTASILVSAFKDSLGWNSLNGLFKEPFNFELIKKHCDNFIFIHSDNDPYCPIEHAEYLAKQTDGKLIKFEGQGHFNTELGPGYKQFPQLLEIIDGIVTF